jgi:polyhydroxybutyrate depolymerase
VAACAVVTVALAGCGSSSYGGGGSASPATAPPAAATTPVAAAGACPAATRRAPATVPGAPLRTLLRVPAGARGRRVPLVLALHYASGTGAQMEQVTRLTPEARRAGFVVAYPTATEGNVWDADVDLPKLERTLDAVQRAACIDARRVYAVGISNGGGAASRLACRAAGRIAAVALFAPAVSGDDPTCRPSRPVGVLEVHGTADPLVPYAGVAPFMAGWVRRDGCSAPRDERVGAKVTRRRWPGCRGGVRVEHLRVAGGRHIELLADLRAAGTDPADTAWRFLRAHRVAR